MSVNKINQEWHRFSCGFFIFLSVEIKKNPWICLFIFTLKESLHGCESISNHSAIISSSQAIEEERINFCFVVLINLQANLTFYRSIDKIDLFAVVVWYYGHGSLKSVTVEYFFSFLFCQIGFRTSVSSEFCFGLFYLFLLMLLSPRMCVLIFFFIQLNLHSKYEMKVFPLYA